MTTPTPIDYEPLDRSATLIDAFERSRVDPDSLAITYIETGCDPVRTTRAEFAITARRYAAAVRAVGIRPGDLVLVAHEDTMSLFYSFWGLLLVGAIPSIYTIPNERLFPEIYMANVAALVKDIDARALLTSDALAEQFASRIPCPVTGFSRVLEALPEARAAAPAPGHRAQPEDLAYVQTSSGTTGNQRCVPTTHRMVLVQLAALARRMDVRRDDVIANWMPLYHDGGLILGAVMPLLCGVPVVMMSPLDWVRHPAILFHAIGQHGATFCNMPNFAFNHLVRRVRERDLEGLSLAGVRAFVNGSERVYHTSFEGFLERFGPLGVTRDRLGVAYGLAENTLMAAHTRTGDPLVYDAVDRRRLELEQIAAPADPAHADAVINVSCGPPLDGVAIEIRDDDDRPLPERRVGQVAIRSGSLFTGYHRRPDLSADLFRGEWFLTGDMGYLADGQLYVVGRLKDLIINGGKNIYPADLEEIVSTIPGVRPGRVAVFGVPDETEGTELIAVVAEIDSEDPEVKAEAGRQIRRAITQQMSLTVSFVDVLSERWIIKTSSGKTSRVANRRKWLEGRAARG
jgi:acyl-CoA synthetase (AMP-forming)/AMP-acid ligase II